MRVPDPVAFARFGGPPEHRAVLLHCAGDAEDEIDCRMFFDHDGIDEDPATGSANGALAGLLATLDPRPDVELAWRSRQGDDMGRPSRLALRAIKRDGAVRDVFVGGRSVAVAEGVLHLDG